MDEIYHKYWSVHLVSKTSCELGTYRLRNKNVDLHHNVLCTGGCADFCNSLWKMIWNKIYYKGGPAASWPTLAKWLGFTQNSHFHAVYHVKAWCFLSTTRFNTKLSPICPLYMQIRVLYDSCSRQPSLLYITSIELSLNLLKPKTYIMYRQL